MIVCSCQEIHICVADLRDAHGSCPGSAGNAGVQGACSPTRAVPATSSAFSSAHTHTRTRAPVSGLCAYSYPLPSQPPPSRLLRNRSESDGVEQSATQEQEEEDEADSSSDDSSDQADAAQSIWSLRPGGMPCSLLSGLSHLPLAAAPPVRTAESDARESLKPAIEETQPTTGTTSTA